MTSKPNGSRLVRAAALGLLALTGTLATGCASQPPVQASHAPAAREGYLARLETLAILQTLNSRLLAGRSATLTLEAWCGEHRLAPAPRIVARLVRDVVKAPSAETRARLNVGPDEKLIHRHVQLACGERVLSVADNWYAPGRLTAEMNRQLETTDTPFGKVVQQLDFHRVTLAAELLWSPLPEGWEIDTSAADDVQAPLAIPPEIIRHNAVLYSRDNAPIAEVVETYSRELLAFRKAAGG